MREIPSLQILCLRSIGPHACSAEATFASTNKTTPSVASRLLQSCCRALPRSPCIGTGSARRVNGNEVDMVHPIGAVVAAAVAASTSDDTLLLKYGNPATDVLQSYIDSLVELGRMDDQRLGVHFFEEWKRNVVLMAAASDTNETTTTVSQSSSAIKKRRLDTTSTITSLGSLSLYNCNLALDTFESMRTAKIGPHLGSLDLSGIRGLTNDLLDMLLPDCPNLTDLGLKNCRRITHIHVVAKHQRQLTTLDIGGAYNLDTNHVLDDVLPQLPKLDKLHASGLGWNDTSMQKLVQLRNGDWKQLSLSFSLTLSPGALRTNLMPLANTLTCLALAFCETIIDNAAMGLLGRNLPHVRALDVRGNPALTTLTGWYDGRVSADLPAQPLSVLGRYSGLSESSVEETKRVHPNETMDLVVYLDTGGTGAALLVGA